MSSFVTRIAAAAVIALAAVPVVAVGAANAGESGARIAVSKIDFTRAENVVAFNGKIASLQRQFCSNGQKRSLADGARCRQAVLEEIVSQLSRQQRVALGVAASTRG